MKPSPTTMTDITTLGSAAQGLSAPHAPTLRPTSPDTDEIAHDGWFYSDHIVFLVENRLFKVPKQKFVQNSKIFRDMFELPPGATPPEGQTDDMPVTLEGVKKDEFSALLRVMFKPVHAPSLEEAAVLTMEDWMLVLKLTTMWRFDDLRRTAISTLTQHVQKSDPVTWLCLARQYNVGDWLSPSLLALVKREMPMQMEDVGPLGVETVVKIAELRERAARGRDYNGSYAVHTRPLSVPMEIARLFDEELKQARENY